MTEEQLTMGFGPTIANAVTSRDGVGNIWIGLALDYRQLFDGLAEDWLRSDGNGFVLGVCSFIASDESRYLVSAIRAHVAFDVQLMPDLKILVRRNNEWQHISIQNLSYSDKEIWWPGDLPLFLIKRAFVQTSEDLVRIVSIAKQASNILMPEFTVRHVSVRPPARPVAEVNAKITIQYTAEQDKLRGATSMAFWAVPRIDPWMKLLAESITGGNAVGQLVSDVRASWWVHPPWSDIAQIGDTEDAQLALWSSAIDVLRSGSESRWSSLDVVSQIAERAVLLLASEAKAHVLSWATESIQLAKATRSLRDEDWKTSPVGCAIQLVLLRPEPTRFKAWLDDVSDLPPGVWWSAAVLCGLLHGYRRLETQFRGDLAQRTLLAIHSYSRHAATPAGYFMSLPSGVPTVFERDDSIGFHWGAYEFSVRPQTARYRWFHADLSKEVLRTAAFQIARRNSWRCFAYKFSFSDDEMMVSRPEVDRTTEPQGVRMRFENSVTGTLPQGTELEPVFDVKAFTRSILTEGGRMPVPPALDSHDRSYSIPVEAREAREQMVKTEVKAEIELIQHRLLELRHSLRLLEEKGERRVEDAPRKIDRLRSHFESRSGEPRRLEPRPHFENRPGEPPQLEPRDPHGHRPSARASGIATESGVQRHGQLLMPSSFQELDRRASAPAPAGSAPEADLVVPGLLYCPNFLTSAEALSLIASIDAEPWRSDLRRRVQHYGWRYDYADRAIDRSMYLGPLPVWVGSVAEKLHRGQLLDFVPDQVIVNEYLCDQYISKHVDCPSCFTDGIAMISLLESWEMIFRSGRRKHSILLEANSATIMTGDARYTWTHEIPRRLKEPDGRVRGRRVSVTFRKVILDRSPGRFA